MLLIMLTRSFPLSLSKMRFTAQGMSYQWHCNRALVAQSCLLMAKHETALSVPSSKRITSHSKFSSLRFSDKRVHTQPILDPRSIKSNDAVLPAMSAISARSYVVETIPRSSSQLLTLRHMSTSSTTASPASSNSMKSPHSTTRSNKEIPSSTSSKYLATQQSSVFKAEKTGMYIRNWPEVYPAPTHFKRALRSLKHVSVDTSIKNIRNKERKYAAQQLDTLMKALTVPITQLITLYQFGFRTLHPFEVNYFPRLFDASFSY